MTDKERAGDREGRVYALPLINAGMLDERADRIVSENEIERYELPLGMARFCAYAFIGMFLIFLIWASLAQIDVVARAPGQLRPYGRPKLVQSQLNGKIQRINVVEGMHVEQNDPLVELESQVYQSQLDERLLAVQQERIKLQQMQQGRDALVAILRQPNVLPATASDLGDVSQVVNDVYTTQQALSQARYDASSGKLEAPHQMQGDLDNLKKMQSQLESEREQKTQQIALLKSANQKEEAEKKAAIASLSQQISGQKQMLDASKKSLDLARQQEQDYAKALDVGVSQVQYLDIKQKVGEYEKKIIEGKDTINSLRNQLLIATLDLPRWKLQSENEILRLESEVNSTIGNIGDVRIRMRGTTKSLDTAITNANAALEHARAAFAGQTSEMAAQLAVVQERQKAADEIRIVVGQTTISAPMAGVVTGLVVRAPGEVVTAGEQLMDILPDRSDIIFEANVSDADIGFIHPGQNVKLKLDAFPYQDFGVLNGTVLEIERFPEQSNKGFSYLVRIQPEQMEMDAQGKKIHLRQGLTAECDIILRKMSVLQALLRPLARYGYLNIKP